MSDAARRKRVSAWTVVSDLLDLIFVLGTVVVVMFAMIFFAAADWERFNHFAVLGGLFLLLDIRSLISRRKRV